MLRCFLFSLFLTVSAFGQISIGATKKEVIDTLGWPKSSSGNQAREILNYADYTVFLVEGRVSKLEHKPRTSPARQKPVARPAPAQPAPVSVPTAAPDPALSSQRPTRSPTPGHQSQAQPTRSAQPPVSQPTPSSRPQPTIDPFAAAKRMVFWVTIIFGALVALKLWARSYLKARKADPFDRLSGTSKSKDTPHNTVPALAPPVRPDPLKDGWSLKLLRSIEWHRFEHLVAAYEREMGHDADLTSFGADGGIDVVLFPAGSRTPSRIIQCKAFTQQKVGVDLVRAFYGVMTLRKVPKGSFYTTGSFSDDAFSIGLENENLDLIDGQNFLNRILRLPLSAQLRLFGIATKGDYTTPTCANCGVKMILKTAEKGRDTGNRFWGCRNFPRCRSTLKIAQP